MDNATRVQTCGPRPIVGPHHVTAIASDPQWNPDFYTSVLGLRFVRRTVTFNDPGTYHFYFGDDAGSPGTILTFFSWPHTRRGAPGTGETPVTAFCVPSASLPFWHDRLTHAGVPVEEELERFGDSVLGFADPDGRRLEWIASDAAAPRPARFSDLPAEHSIRGFHSVTLCEAGFASTAAVLGRMGFEQTLNAGDRSRFSAPAMRRAASSIGCSRSAPTADWKRAMCTTSRSVLRIVRRSSPCARCRHTPAWM